MSIIPSIVHISGIGTPRVIIVYPEAQFTSDAATTYDATHAHRAGQAFTGVQVNQRVSSYCMRGTVPIPTFGKVTGISSGALKVDGWTNGTPTAGRIFKVDGYVVDLPRAQEMTETFDPDILKHSLYRKNKGSKTVTKMRGWKYDCVLDYRKYFSPDDLLTLRRVLAQAANDLLILIPRRDFPAAQYNVYFNDAIRISRYGRAPGYKKLIFAFKATTNLPSWGMITGHGTNYGNDYGNTGW